MEERKKKIYNYIYTNCKINKKYPEYLSFSKMEKYFKCQLSYKIQYKDKKKIKYKENLHADLGDLSHGMVERYEKFNWSREKLLKEFTTNASIIVKKYNETLDLPLLTSLLHFFENSTFIDKLKDYEVEFEKPIYFKVKEEGNKEYWYVGFIDLVLKDKEGKVHIVDFKTSNVSSYSGEKLKFNILQLMCYAYFYELQYKEKVEDVSYLFMKYCNITYIDEKDKKRRKSKLERRHITKELLDKGGKVETLEVADTLVTQVLDKETKTQGMKDFLVKLFESLNAKEFDASKRDRYYCEKFCPFRNSEYCNYKDKEDETIESSAQQLSDFVLSQIGEENE